MEIFSAHIIFYFKNKYDNDLCHYDDTDFVVWENIVIFVCENLDEAFKKANTRGHIDAQSTDEELQLDGHPADMIFGGVRKVVESDLLPNDANLELIASSIDGLEVSYTKMIVKGFDNLANLINGDESVVQINAVGGGVE